jgi:hypothetical protein
VAGELPAEYEDIFRRIPKSGDTPGRPRFIYDPLNLPVAVIPLHGGFYLLVSGGYKKRPSEREPTPPTPDPRVMPHKAPPVSLLSLDELKEKGRCVEAVYAYLSRLDGETLLHLQWHVVPLAGEDGVAEGAIVVFEDVTEAVRLRRQMQDWERLATAGEVAAGLAHEIRNPLTAAVGAIELCDLVDSEPKRQEIPVGV